MSHINQLRIDLERTGMTEREGAARTAGSWLAIAAALAVVMAAAPSHRADAGQAAPHRHGEARFAMRIALAKLTLNIEWSDRT
jgi:hypothetical protein